MRAIDRLQDTPAQIISGVGETLVQTPLAVALLGDQTAYDGLARSTVYRWFTDPSSRRIYPEDDHLLRGRMFTADLRTAYARDGAGSRAEELVNALLGASEEFAELWAEHEVGLRHSEQKRIQNAEVGILELHCQVLYDVEQSQGLLVFTAVPGSESHEKLQLLSVIGAQQLDTSRGS
jgi:hypothetical protein